MKWNGLKHLLLGVYCPVLSTILEYLTKLNKLTCTIMTIRNIYSAHKSVCAGLCLANHPHCIYTYISPHTHSVVKQSIPLMLTVVFVATVLQFYGHFHFDFGTMIMPEHHSTSWFTFSVTPSCNILCNSASTLGKRGWLHILTLS